jgi:hypothetical protein
MTLSADKAVSLIATFLFATYTFAASETNICSELSGYFAGNHALKLPDPSRKPTKKERQFIETSAIELLESTDYSMGTFIVDGDNDGKNDLFAWNIQGSGRFVYAELFDIPSSQDAKKLVPKASLELGVLQDPRFIRFKGINYLVSTDTGDGDGISVSALAKVANGRYEHQTLCHMKAVVRPESDCRHPACKKLKEVIENKNDNDLFVSIEWPHKYFAPAGLAVYFRESGSEGDFDNSKNPTSIWRIGRKGYINQHIYWALLGQGDEMPDVDPKLRPMSEDKTVRRVLPGRQHDRLRRTLAQQSEVLGRELHRPVSLPNEGEFFLFSANEKRTYWAWDFGDPPYGEEIHITYTNATKSDYIGVVRVKRRLVLEPCSQNCVTPLDP